MTKAKQILLDKVRQLRSKAAAKMRESVRFEAEADEIEKQAKAME